MVISKRDDRSQEPASPAQHRPGPPAVAASERGKSPAGRPGNGHSTGPKVPYAESVGALRELLDAGKIRLAGISNASIEQIDIARSVLGEGNLASVQNQFSPAFRSSEAELRHCADLGITFLPWSPLGGIGQAGELGARHAAFEDVARAHGVSPQQVTLAWMLAKAPVVIPIPGGEQARVGHRLGQGRGPRA